MHFAITSIADFNAQDFGQQLTVALMDLNLPKPNWTSYTSVTNPNQDPNGLNFGTSGDNKTVKLQILFIIRNSINILNKTLPRSSITC